ncbi:hypothetical protein FACS1894133_7440 [Clostridia bacterium]|nr:hypothetical protein FACS1894133_7440 [Clostridia bacterium]
MQFIHYLFIFEIFNLIGWCFECSIESLYHKQFINRGFLKGPWIPVYGAGGLVMMLVCVPFSARALNVFFVGMIACTILEYAVGSLMEAVFRKQFWDYSMMRFVYKNRISLVSSLVWGLLSLFMAYCLYGIVTNLALSVPIIPLAGVALSIAGLMVADCVYCTCENLNLRIRIRKMSKRQIRVLFYRRLRTLSRPVTYLQKILVGRLPTRNFINMKKLRGTLLWWVLPFSENTDFDTYFDDLEWLDTADADDGDADGVSKQ